MALASYQGQAWVLWPARVSSSLDVQALDDCDLPKGKPNLVEVKEAYSARGTVALEHVLRLPYGDAQVLHSHTGQTLG